MNLSYPLLLNVDTQSSKYLMPLGICHFSFIWAIFSRYGSGAEQSTKSILCVLPMNMFNQKVYTAFFVWLGVLLIASGLLLILRIFMVSSTLFRGVYVKLFYNLNSLSWDSGSMDVSLALKMSWKLFFNFSFSFYRIF